jgi:hypothetical protein
MVKSITNEFLAMTYPDEYYKNVIEPAKTGKGPVPSKMQMLSKAQPFKAVSLPFQEMMNPGKFGSFRSTATPAAARALGIGRMALGGPFGIAALAGQGLGMGVDAIARATNTPEEYEAMKQAARDQGGFGYFDDVDISQDAVSPTTTTPGSVMNEIEIDTAPGIFDINEVGDPALNAGSVNAMGIDPFGVNEDLIDRGNPLGDSRVVSEEQGLSGGFVPTNRPNMRDIAGDINLNMTDLGNPLGDSRIASEEQGLSGFPGLGQVDPGFQNVLDAREARRNEIAMQQNPDYGQFFDAEPVNEPKRGIDLGLLGLLAGPAGFLTGSNALRGIGLAANIASGRVGRGLASLNRTMRGVNPDGTTRTQSQYEQARTERQQQNRTDRMIDRITSGKRTSKNPRSAGTTAKQKADISAALRESRRAGQYTDKDSSGSSGSGTAKIVCTMMNERYGFGSFRNKIWMKFHENHGPEYQKGYHAIFLPLVKIAKGEGKINTAVRKVLEHMGRHVTADMFKIMKGKKRDTLGRIYRAIFEPACHIIGKIKSALGRG